mgnify:FL=1
MMKAWKKKLAAFLCIGALAALPAAPALAEETAAEESQNIENGDRQPLNANQAMALIQAVASHVSAFGRYENLNERNMYKAGMERLISENPDLYNSVLKGMLESVDSYSEYYTPEEAVALTETISGKIVGIGISIDFRNGAAAVVDSVIPDTPAERAGIKVGDVLLRADGTDLTELKSETILSLIRGEEGTNVHIDVSRDGAELGFDMVRETIIGTSVSDKLYEKDGEKVMYIRVHGFVSNTAEKFSEAIEKAKKEKTDKLIIDLRNNGGGIFEQAIQMANCLVPEGKVITTEDHKNEIFNKTYVASAGEKGSFDTVVLVNKNSASASEVLAAALRENDCAVLVGTQTYGKGTIQTINDLQTGGMIKYTTGFYLTPNGNNINGVGRTPDATVENELLPIDPERYGAFTYDKVYALGDTGEEVKRAKEVLSLFGIFRGEVSDVYDQDLFYAVYAFQQQAKVFPYGVLDLTTQLQLRNYLSMAKEEKDDQFDAAMAHFGLYDVEK